MDLSFIEEFRTNVGRFDTERKQKQTPPQNVTRVADLGDNVKYDVYFPNDAQGKLPTIIDIHGGGWIYGDKQLNDIYAANLAVKGFAVVEVDYRLVPEANLQMQLADIFDCLHHLANNFEKLDNIDIDKVFVVGDSAGGHLASMVYAVNQLPRLQALYCVNKLPFAIHAVGLSHPVLDPQRSLKKLKRHKITAELLLPTIDYKRNSSWYDMPDLLLPPTYLISCGADDLSPLSQVTARWLKKKGADYIFDFYNKRDYPHLSHVFDVTYPHYSESQRTIDDMLKFFLSKLPSAN